MIRFTGDDYGHRPEGDAILLELASQGCIHALSAFVNLPDAGRACQTYISAGRPQPMGCHINLTHGAPVCMPKHIPSLVDRNGQFLSHADFVKAWRNHKIDQEHLLLETGSQLKRFTDLYGYPEHVDSHHHVHRFPQVARALGTHLAQYPKTIRLRTLRRHFCHSRESRRGQWMLSLKFNMEDWSRFPGSLVKSRAHHLMLAGGSESGDGLITPVPEIDPEHPKAVARWIHVVEQLPHKGSWEALFHPGWSQAEARFLRHPELRAAIIRHNSAGT